MVRRRILAAVGVVTGTVSILLSAAFMGSANAAQTASVGGNALKISPVRLDLKMDPGTSQTFTVSIQNLTSVQAALHPAVTDFVASGDETGRPNIILDENEYAPSHSLKRLITPIKDFTVQPHESKDVKFSVTVPKNAVGGYYGAVRFSPANSEGSKNVNLAASVGTLVLLKVNGDLKEDLSVESFDVRTKNKPGNFFTTNKNLTVTTRFKNMGNVQVEPFGKIALKRFGKPVTQYNLTPVDQQRSSVLPDSVRRFDVPLTKVSAFGKYTLEGNFGYGETGQLLTAQTTFYVVPVPMILLGVGAVLLVVFLIFGLPRMIRAYNRRIIRRAGRRR